MGHRERLALFCHVDLYLVITERFCRGRAALEVLEAALAAGVRAVQLREKDLESRALFERALLFRERTSRAGALLIVNDRLDIALAAGADGVHLGQGDLPVGAARGIAPELLIGASTHGQEQAIAAQREGASYVNIGPIFPTGTKETAVGPLGPAAIECIAPQLTIPFTVMGGITLGNVGEVVCRGARHVAVVTAVTAAPDVRVAAEQLRTAIVRLAQREK